MKRSLPYLLIVLGSFIYSIGLNAFIVGNQLAEGGFVGLSIVLLYKMSIPIGASFLILNIPVLILGWHFFGRKFIIKTMLGVVAVSIFTVLTQHLAEPVHDRLLAALYGGVICGAGLGIIFRSGGTTGGVDILARIVRHFFNHSMGRIMFASDVVVISLVALVINMETAMYSLVALFVSSRVIDFVIEGISASRAAMIISDHWNEIADRIHTEMGRGTTLFYGQGGYTGEAKQIVYCVVSRDEVVRLQQLVHEIDDRAFVVLNDVNDVLGEGFTR
ncbi:YitT family protein [Sulfoacidibacillus thermotolerans]|uniref:YitT family protein n=1 Tax=Sulfoacidibacillus thermotolerans TaxID=1765684 RepID=UPI0026851CEA